MDFQRQLLAELMNPLIGDAGTKYTDKSVCKNFLVGFCPHELFTNTKADLGPCKLLHDERIKAQYQKSNEKGRFGWERDFFGTLERLVNDVNWSIRRNREKLHLKGQDAGQWQKSEEQLQEKKVLVEKLILELIAKIQQLGESGRIEEAIKSLAEKDKLQEQLEAVHHEIKEAENWKNDRRMEVCDVCGAFLVSGEVNSKTDAHKEGKQHTGYQKIRDAYEEVRGEFDRRDRFDDRGPRRKDSRDHGYRRDDRHRSSRDFHDDPYDRRARSPRR